MVNVQFEGKNRKFEQEGEFLRDVADVLDRTPVLVKYLLKLRLAQNEKKAKQILFRFSMLMLVAMGGMILYWISKNIYLIY